MISFDNSRAPRLPRSGDGAPGRSPVGLRGLLCLVNRTSQNLVNRTAVKLLRRALEYSPAEELCLVQLVPIVHLAFASGVMASEPNAAVNFQSNHFGGPCEVKSP